MKLKVLVASAFLASSAMAAVESDSKIIARFDYENAQSETKVGATKTETSSGDFQVNYLRWKNTAKFNDTITGELTLNFLRPANGVAGNSQLTEFVDTAFITKSFGPGFTATIGKQAVLIGGRENDWSSSDMYLVSRYNFNTPFNAIGLTVGYTVADQTFYAQHLESDNAVLTDKKMTGLAWYGNLMNNMINPIVSYHKIGTDRPGQYDILMAAGLQFNMNMFLVEADYLTRTNENGGFNSVGAVADAELKTMVGHVRYNHENFRPFVKYIKEDGEGSFGLVTGLTAVEQERTAYEVGLEYVPNKDEAMRYHVVYNTSESKDSTGATPTTIETDMIYAGVKWSLSL